MSVNLVVRGDFAAYRRGDSITDPGTVAGIFAGGQTEYVVMVPATEINRITESGYDRTTEDGNNRITE